MTDVTPETSTAGPAPEAGTVALVADVYREAWRCYRSHLGPVIGLALVGSIQRAALQWWGDGWSGATVGLLELTVMASRIGIVVLAFRWLISADQSLRGIGFREGLRRVGRYLRRHWRAAIGLVVSLMAVGVVTDLIPDVVIGRRIPEDTRATYFAILLAVKNPTVIAYTMLWDVALLHQALRLGGPDRERRISAAP
jgi:hypothetical protein